SHVFFLLVTLRPPPRPPLFPYTTLFRSAPLGIGEVRQPRVVVGSAVAVVDLEVELIGGDQGEHHAVLVDAEAAEHGAGADAAKRSEEHTSELQSRENLVCRLLLEKKKNK